MDNLRFIVLFSVLLLPAMASAQPPPVGDCPSIYVLGPAGITLPGESMTFTAEVKPFDPEKMTLVWTVSSRGTSSVIEKGQGTDSILVRYALDGSNMTATLTVKGLPAGCPDSASETAGVVISALPMSLDEYGPLKPRDERARLAKVAFQMTAQPDTVAIFYFRYPSSITRAMIEATNARILKRLAALGRISLNRVKFAYAESDSSVTKIYLWPRTAEWPEYASDLDIFRPRKPNKK